LLISEIQIDVSYFNVFLCIFSGADKI